MNDIHDSDYESLGEESLPKRPLKRVKKLRETNENTSYQSELVPSDTDEKSTPAPVYSDSEHSDDDPDVLEEIEKEEEKHKETFIDDEPVQDDPAFYRTIQTTEIMESIEEEKQLRNMLREKRRQEKAARNGSKETEEKEAETPNDSHRKETEPYENGSNGNSNGNMEEANEEGGDRGAIDTETNTDEMPALESIAEDKVTKVIYGVTRAYQGYGILFAHITNDLHDEMFLRKKPKKRTSKKKSSDVVEDDEETRTLLQEVDMGDIRLVGPLIHSLQSSVAVCKVEIQQLDAHKWTLLKVLEYKIPPKAVSSWPALSKWLTLYNNPIDSKAAEYKTVKDRFKYPSSLVNALRDDTDREQVQEISSNYMIGKQFLTLHLIHVGMLRLLELFGSSFVKTYNSHRNSFKNTEEVEDLTWAVIQKLWKLGAKFERHFVPDILEYYPQHISDIMAMHTVDLAYEGLCDKSGDTRKAMDVDYVFETPEIVTHWASMKRAGNSVGEISVKIEMFKPTIGDKPQRPVFHFVKKSDTEKEEEIGKWFIKMKKAGIRIKCVQATDDCTYNGDQSYVARVIKILDSQTSAFVTTFKNRLTYALQKHTVCHIPEKSGTISLAFTNLRKEDVTLLVIDRAHSIDLGQFLTLKSILDSRRNPITDLILVGNVSVRPATKSASVFLDLFRSNKFITETWKCPSISEIPTSRIATFVSSYNEFEAWRTEDKIRAKNIWVLLHNDYAYNSIPNSKMAENLDENAKINHAIFDLNSLTRMDIANCMQFITADTEKNIVIIGTKAQLEILDKRPVKRRNTWLNTVLKKMF